MNKIKEGVILSLCFIFVTVDYALVSLDIIKDKLCTKQN